MIIGFVLLALVITGLILWKLESSTRTLPDGTRIVLSEVRAGRTNVHLHGTLLSKALGRFASIRRISIAGYEIKQPARVILRTYGPDDVLSVQFQFLRYRRFRVFITGDDGFCYGHYELRKHDGSYAYLCADAWPRTSRLLRIRLEEEVSSSGREGREVASFTVRNPKRVKPPIWLAEPSFKTTLPDDVEVETGELVARIGPIHRSDFREHTAELPVRFSRAGEVLRNWEIFSDSFFTDADGNSGGFGSVKHGANGFAVYQLRGFRPVNPFQPWRFEVTFGMGSDFPETNLFRFTVPWRMPGTNHTNFAGVPVAISYVNSMLAVELPTCPKEFRVTFISALGDGGENVDDSSGSVRQHDFWRALNPRGSSNIHATIAIHPNYPASFTLQPRHERAKGAEAEGLK